MVTQNLRVFAYIVWGYKSSADAASLLSSVASWAMKMLFGHWFRNTIDSGTSFRFFKKIANSKT